MAASLGWSFSPGIRTSRSARQRSAPTLAAWATRLFSALPNRAASDQALLTTPARMLPTAKMEECNVTSGGNGTEADAENAPAPDHCGAIDAGESSRILGGGPRLNVEEWIALTQIHRVNGGKALAPEHPDLVAASPRLARLAEIRGSARPGARLRSPEGLARRLAVLRRIERGDCERVPRDALCAWERFQQEPEAAEAAAWFILGERAPTYPPDTSTNAMAAPSRGPVPYSGTLSVKRLGAPEWVYLMLLEGSGSVATAAGLSYIKVGRSTDPGRRQIELNQGFPPDLGIEWRPFHLIGPMGPAEAYALEQDILRTLSGRGLSTGGEFSRGAPDSIRELADQVAARMLRPYLPAIPLLTH